MIDGHSVLAVIPARGGSKGVPRKNLAELGGKHLIAWTIEAARGSRHIDKTVLSSEDSEIIAAAKELGCEVPFVRHTALADDVTGGTAVLLDAIDRLPGFDYAVLLQPTSPLRTSEDIDTCIEQCVAAGASSCVAVCALSKPAEWLMKVGADGRLRPLLDGKLPERRQDATEIFVPNGAVFVARTTELKASRTFYGPKTVAHVMPAERSVDIDTPLDLELARQLVC